MYISTYADYLPPESSSLPPLQDGAPQRVVTVTSVMMVPISLNHYPPGRILGGEVELCTPVAGQVYGRDLCVVR